MEKGNARRNGINVDNASLELSWSSAWKSNYREQIGSQDRMQDRWINKRLQCMKDSSQQEGISIK